jgi:ABC-type Na+ efflux pump permease subunit
MLNPVKPALWMMLVPSLGQVLLMNDVLGGVPLDTVHFAVAAAAGVLATLLFLLMAKRLFQREKIIFGR